MIGNTLSSSPLWPPATVRRALCSGCHQHIYCRHFSSQSSISTCQLRLWCAQCALSPFKVVTFHLASFCQQHLVNAPLICLMRVVFVFVHLYVFIFVFLSPAIARATFGPVVHSYTVSFEGRTICIVIVVFALKLSFLYI